MDKVCVINSKKYKHQSQAVSAELNITPSLNPTWPTRHTTLNVAHCRELRFIANPLILQEGDFRLETIIQSNCNTPGIVCFLVFN